MNVGRKESVCRQAITVVVETFLQANTQRKRLNSPFAIQVPLEEDILWGKFHPHQVQFFFIS